MTHPLDAPRWLQIDGRPPRYTVRFTNGTWRVFDLVKYEARSIEGLRRDAADFAARLNNAGPAR